ncbi:MAG: helix-turn-helix domain-containing protein [Candidatus Aminicenantes bacterium]|nr:helix-turn-helix domain-containing protein [Candidatus Aminicenantes bacterium]MDH5715019.1 helix-turn-helix domain-containing protein [Candidatus Aminicenantes bacterium]
MPHDIKNILHFIIIFQCLIFSFYLLTQKNNRWLSNIILAAFLLSKAFSEVGGVLAHFGALRSYVISHFPHLCYIDFPFHYVYVPVLFLYILSFTKMGFKFKKVYLLHFTPFIFFCILIILKLHINSADTIREILQTGSRFDSFEDQLFYFLEYLQFFSYAIASLIVLKKYRIEIKNIYSTIEHINLSWLNFVIFGFIGWKSLIVLEYVLWIITENMSVIFLYISAEVVFLIFVSLMFFKGLKQPEIFSGTNENQFKRKYEKTLLPDAIKRDYKNKLIRYVETKKPYLDPSLSLNDLAEKVSIPPHHLSQILNSCLNQNFFDFINSYRIKESKRLLSEQSSDKKTILEILYETGFNSKSVFNTAFKKHTGMTPTQFRQLQNS